jgi:hypothetical protein
VTPLTYYLRWLVIFACLAYPFYWCIRLAVRHGIQDTFTQEP